MTSLSAMHDAAHVGAERGELQGDPARPLTRARPPSSALAGRSRNRRTAAMRAAPLRVPGVEQQRPLPPAGPEQLHGLPIGDQYSASGSTPRRRSPPSPARPRFAAGPPPARSGSPDVGRHPLERPEHRLELERLRLGVGGHRLTPPQRERRCAGARRPAARARARPGPRPPARRRRRRASPAAAPARGRAGGRRARRSSAELRRGQHADVARRPRLDDPVPHPLGQLRNGAVPGHLELAAERQRRDRRSGSISCGMTPRSSSTGVLVPASAPAQVQREIGVDPAAQLAQPLVRLGTAAPNQAAGGEHRVPKGLGDQQVPAPLDLLGEAGEAPRREPDGGQDEERGQRHREPDAERPREAPPPRADGSRSPGDQLRQRTRAARARRRRAARPARPARTAAPVHAGRSPREPYAARPAGPADTRSGATSPRDASGGSASARRVGRRAQSEAVERRLLAARVEQSSDPARLDQRASAGRPRPS